MPITTVDRADDPRLEDFRDVMTRDGRGPDGRPGVFIGEQPLVVEAMLDRPGTIRRILVAENKRGWLEKVLADRGDPDLEAIVVPRDLMESTAGFPIHRGILASGDRAGLARSSSVASPPAAREGLQEVGWRRALGRGT